MNQKAAKILEYDKIKAMLTEQAGSAMAKELIKDLQPSDDLRIVSELLAETTEAVKLIVYKGPLPLGNFYDIDSSLTLAKKGGSLTMKQLLRIHYNLSSARNATAFLKGDLPELPIITSMAEVLFTHKELEEQIDRCILSEDEMSDNASSELKNIRRAIVRKNDDIKNKMNRILSSAGNADLLQDSIITIRDGRYVIPVKQEHRSKIAGIVHDQSATGATLFIEPQAIVDINNELRELAIAERAEIERILEELSGRVAEHYDELRNNQKLLVHLDVIMAKGRFSVKQKAEMPQINEGGELILKEARHPLISDDEVVPIDIAIGKGYNTLIITGPNTGGKTVTLKTVGLLSLMAQSGMHIPAQSGSRLPVFKDIFADIGDEQSIEQSLSTFSSHMKNIVEVQADAEEGTLVLLDELGAGTDPTEGAALAISVLEDLFAKKVRVIATTHYTELKKYALSTPGVENASMQFNVETLSPTYKLTIGLPGKSNAFEISRKLGLPENIIDKARHLLDAGALEFEDVVSKIEADKKAAEEERDEAVMINTEMKRRSAELEKEARRLEEKKEKILNKAKEEAKDIVREAKELSQNVQQELKELAKMDSLGERTRKFDESRRRIREAEGRYREKIVKEVNDNPVSADDLRVGDRVKILTLGQNGEIISLPDDRGLLTAQVGTMKVSVNIDDLMLIPDGSKKSIDKTGRSRYGKMYKAKAQMISISVNVQGKNLDDARMDVDKYLDDACIAGLEEVTVIHGRGEGILRKGIQEMLKGHKHVKSFRKGKFDEGGDGVTVVKLK